MANEERDFQVDTMLYDQGVIAKTLYQDSEEAYKYQQKKRAFLEENVKRTKEDNKIQIERINRSIEMKFSFLKILPCSSRLSTVINSKNQIQRASV